MRPTITTRFDSKFQIIAQQFDLIQNEKHTIRTALLCLTEPLTSVTWIAAALSSLLSFHHTDTTFHPYRQSTVAILPQNICFK